MAIEQVLKDLGAATAYAYAVEKGYTGTEAEFAELMASYASVAQSAAASATAAAGSATSAASSASTASAAATTATTKASEASTSATNAAESASSAASSATAASGSATSAAASATTASGKASEATTAATTATTAKTDAVAAKTAAQTAQAGAETAAASVQSSAAQIQTNADDISELKEDFATMESDGVVPSAEQILTDKGITDSVPYHFRKTASDNADREELEIVGGSVAWNQLAKALSSAATTYGITINGNASENSLTLAGTATASRYLSIPSNIFGAAPPPHHVLLMHGYKEAGTYNGNMFLFGNSNNIFTLSAPTIKKPSVIENTQLYVQIENGVEYNFKLRINIFDLTAMFGSTVADYIYDLETAHAGDGVAFFKSLFPNDYYEYNSGELVSVSGLSAHVMRDVDNNIIRSYPLDSTLTLRGISKLVDGKMCFDGDTYDADGTVARKYGVVDLGTLNWGYSQVGTVNMFNAPFSLIKTTGYNNSSVFPLVCPKYSAVAFYASSVYMGNSDKSIAYAPSGGNRFYITDSSYTSADDFKSAMSGVYLVYELATPTTETAEPYINPQICDPNGTEEFVSTGIVPVGHETRYPENLRAKIEGLPWDFSLLIAPTEKTTTASRNYTTGSLLIMGNVLYKVTANIANGGTITPNTNCTATTLAEIISALA